jgi:hypothetical protein
MVKEAYGHEGYNLNLGADILYRAALSDEFAHANGLYFDNDRETFSKAHPDAYSEVTRVRLITVLENIIK